MDKTQGEERVQDSRDGVKNPTQLELDIIKSISDLFDVLKNHQEAIALIKTLFEIVDKKINNLESRITTLEHIESNRREAKP